MSSVTLAYVGLDESGSLSADTSLFTLVGVLTYQPDTIRYLIQRAAVRSGKRLKRPRRAVSELKWHNTSRRLRADVLSRLARADIEIFALTVRKGGRKIEDTPENYAVLVCAVLQACWLAHPNVALAIDRRFTSPAQVAVLNTFLYRHWPTQGVLSISHVDSQRNPLVQLADFVAGSVYAWHKEGDNTIKMIEGKISVALVEDWPEIKQRWTQKRK
ncbi:MAG TPA: DUF3800 domain-containing protein [Anaerolineae bacterium]|nr:DUF3800 domain-containing protein [Anaerolineae bacterium]